MELFKYTSSLLSSKIPQFIRIHYPKFGVFLSHYFDYCDQEGEANHFIANVDAFRNVDSTTLDFLENFVDMYMSRLPKDNTSVLNKRNLVKHIKDFYGSKGTENSIRFLFRMLFNEEIAIYYPTVDILRASDGRWGEEVSIKTSDSIDYTEIPDFRIMKDGRI